MIIKLNLVINVAVLPSPKDFHPNLADFGKDQFSVCENDQEKIKTKRLDSFLIDSVTPFQSQKWKPIKKKTKTLLQQFVKLNDADITVNVDPIEKNIWQDDNPIHPDLSLNSKKIHEQANTTSPVNSPSTSEKYKHSEDEVLQLQTIHQTYPSVIEQSLNIWFHDSSFFKYTSKINDTF